MVAASVLEEDMFGFWEEFAHGPGAAYGEDDGATWFRSGVPFVNYNGVLGVGCDVDAMLERVRSWGVPARWIVGSTHAAEVEPALARSGLQLIDESPGMVARIEDLVEPSDALTVEVVTEDRQRQEWNGVFHDAFGFPPDVAAHVREAGGAAGDPRRLPVYASLGFEVVCSFRSWRIA